MVITLYWRSSHGLSHYYSSSDGYFNVTLIVYRGDKVCREPDGTIVDYYDHDESDDDWPYSSEYEEEESDDDN